MPMALAEPLPVVPLLELQQRQAQFLAGVERPHPESLLFECADEALGHPVALGLPYERRTRDDPQELQLVLEVVADVLAPVIMAREQPTRDPALVRPEQRLDPLAQRFHRLEAGARLGGM